MKAVLKSWYEKIKNNPDIVFYVCLGLYLIFMIVISQFRDMIKDEALYYRETWLITELIQSGKWIGNYAVGLHGFLFKLPPALVFLITGPSIDVVTIYNILLSIGVGFFFYKFVKTFLKNGWYAFFATALLMTNFHFVISTPTYLREIPSLLIIVWFMYAVLKDWNKYWMALIFVLLLDTKEYVFLVFVIVYVVWLFITSKENKFIKKVWDVFKQCLVIFLPSLIWMILMFTTSVIPVNMYLASIIGLIQNSLSYTLKHFESDFTTVNMIDDGPTIQTIAIDSATAVAGFLPNLWHTIVTFLKEVYNIVMPYVGKILYPRTFSFLAVPKIVIFPVVASSIITLVNYIKQKKVPKLFIFSSLLIVVWMIFYIFRLSHGRYLLPIVPAIAIMIIYTFFYSKFTIKQKKSILIGTGIFVVAGFFFESSYIIEKVIIELTLLGILWVRFFKPHLECLKYVFLGLVAVTSFGVANLFSYTKGQIYGYLNWGKNRNISQLASIIPNDVVYWTNNYDNQNAVAVLKGETYNLAEWKWNLNSKIEAIRGLKTIGNKYGYNFDIVDLTDFKASVKQLNIKEVVLMRSNVKGADFPDQEWLAKLLKCKWLKLKNTVNLTGEDIYVFEVVEQ